MKMRLPTLLQFLPAALVLQGWLPVCPGQEAEAPESPRTTGAGPLVDKARAQAGKKSPLRVGAAAKKGSKPAEPADEGDPTPLGVNLIAVHLVSKPSKPMPEGKSLVVAVDPALNLPPNLGDVLQEEFLGKPVSMALLNRMVKKITKAYQATNFPLVDAYLPEQDVTAGQVQVVVREAVLGAVRVEGAKYNKPESLIRQMHVKEGDLIDTALIERDVEWLNESPVRNVSVVYERGAKEGTSDVILKTEDSRPFQVYAGFANTGIQATGMNEWSGGFNWSQVLGTEQAIGYNFSGNDYLDKINTHALVYSIPLPWRHRLQLIGVYATTDVQSGGTLGVEGESKQLSAAYTIPLPRLWQNMRNNLTIAADYKSTNSDIFFGGQSLTKTSAEVLQFRIGYDATVTDTLGYTHIGLAGIYSPGNLLRNNTDAAFNLLRAGAQADYWYGKVELDRLVKLPRGFSLMLHASGQHSDKRLLSTEQLQAGGYRTVRGFQESIARGDSGVLASIELNLPPLHFIFRDGKRADEFIPFIFYDTAYLTSVDALATEPNQTLQSVGIGFRYSIKDYCDLRLAYGWNIGDSGIPNARPGHVHFGATVKF